VYLQTTALRRRYIDVPWSVFVPRRLNRRGVCLTKPALKTASTPLGVCPPHDVFRLIGDKWTLFVLYVLSKSSDKRMRSAEIKHAIDGVSQRMFTMTLRKLERDGMLIRHVSSDGPPQVEYEMSSLAKNFIPVMEGLIEWLRSSWPIILESRRNPVRSGAELRNSSDNVAPLSQMLRPNTAASESAYKRPSDRESV
jgi:DNA-binding HxlR family transcriptional regulator